MDPQKDEQRAKVHDCLKAVMDVAQTIPMTQEQQETLVSTVDTLHDIEQAL